MPVSRTSPVPVARLSSSAQSIVQLRTEPLLTDMSHKPSQKMYIMLFSVSDKLNLKVLLMLKPTRASEKGGELVLRFL